MLVLALDTSSAAVTAAVADVGADSDERNLDGFWQRVTVNAKAHGELLAPSIAGCLDEAGARPSDLGAVVAGLGPGPYTGLRVGLVTASALADALGIPGYGVCSLDAIRRHYAVTASSGGRDDGDGWSLDCRGADDRGPELVVTDARRKEVYWAAYRGWRRVDGPGVCRPDDLPRGRWATGAGARMYADVLRGKGIAVFDRDYPDPAALVALALDRIRAGAPSEILAPLYLRRPDAVPPGTPKPVGR